MGTIDKKEMELVETDELMGSDIQFMKLAGLLICLMGLPVSIVLTVISSTDYALLVVACIVGTCWLMYDLVSDLLYRVQVLREELSVAREHEHDLEVEIRFLLPQTDMGRLDYPGPTA